MYKTEIIVVLCKRMFDGIDFTRSSLNDFTRMNFMLFFFFRDAETCLFYHVENQLQILADLSCAEQDQRQRNYGTSKTK